MFRQISQDENTLDSIDTFIYPPTKRIKNKDINDSMYQHMSLFSILSILCGVAATFTLCVTVAYHIKKKQYYTTYTAMDMIQPINIYYT